MATIEYKVGKKDDNDAFLLSNGGIGGSGIGLSHPGGTLSGRCKHSIWMRCQGPLPRNYEEVQFGPLGLWASQDWTSWLRLYIEQS